MRLVELEVNSLPGVETGFRLSELSPGVTVVVGPNASGKSSVVRALRALWNGQEHAHEPVDVSGRFEQVQDDGSVLTWRAVRLGALISWEREGAAAEPPPAPAEHLLHSYLISVETLMENGRTDAAIGDRLHREMSGGYDLPEARRAVELPRDGYQAAARDLTHALAKLEALERERAALQRRLEGRAELKARHARAAERAAAKDRYQRALQLHEHLAEAAEARALAATFPPALARMKGDEGQRFDAEKERLLAAAQRTAAAQERLAHARAALDATGLDGSVLTLAEAEALERDAIRLEECRAEADELERRVAEVRAAVAEPRRLVGVLPDGTRPAAFEAQNLERVEAALGERLAAQAELASARAEGGRLEAERQRMAEPAGEGDALLEDGRLGRAQAALADWLAAPVAAPATRARVAPVVLLLLGALAFVLAAVLALGGGELGALVPGWTRFVALAGREPALLVVTLSGLVLLLVGAVLAFRRGRAATGGDAREAAVAAFTRAGARDPEAWEHLAVAARLEELGAAAAERREHAERSALLERLGADVRDLEARAQARVDDANRRLALLAADTGYDAGAGEAARQGAGFTVWLRAARQLNDQRDRLRGLTASRAELERQADELFTRLVAGLDGTPFRPDDVSTEQVKWQQGRFVGSKLGHARELRVRCEELTGAVRRRDESREAQRSALAELERAQREEGSAGLAQRGLLSGCDIDPHAHDAEAELHALLARLDAWRTASERLHEAETKVKLERAALEEFPQLLEHAADGDVAALQLGLDDCEQAAREQHEHSEEIGALDSEVRAAEKLRLLTAAKAELQRCRDAVEEHRRRAELNELSELLIEDVEHDHRAKREPEVLKRAQAWFGRFTHHSFELRFDANAGREARLLARDTSSGRVLTPAQLSTGTRAQLLLALRVAHASCAEEGGTRLPFFLDEALTTADAGRFEQVATSLLMLAQEDGRQLFYLSARSEDAAAWERAASQVGGELTVIDLAELRRLDAGARWAGAGFVPEPRPVPSPAGLTAAEFGRLLGTTPIDPWRPPSAVHLLHLLADDLALVHRLAQARIVTAGQARSLLEGGERRLLLPEDQEALLRRRLNALDAWHDAWRQGRNLPLDGDAVRASGAVTARFVDDVTALAREVGADPRALLDALREGRIAFFRANSIDALEEWLDEHGYFDTRPMLDESSRILVTAQALADAPGNGDEPVPEARQLVERLEAAVQSEKEPA